MCTQLKIHDTLNEVISLVVPEVSLILAQFYFLLDGPGVSFTAGIVCPQASQMCCDSNFCFNSFHFLAKIMEKSGVMIIFPFSIIIRIANVF